MKKPSFLLVVFLSITLLGGYFWWSFGLQPVDPANKEKIYFTVNKGDGMAEVAERLEKEGLVRDSFRFKLLTLLLGTAGKIKAGGYYLFPAMLPKEIAFVLTKGVDDQWVTVVEGLRSEEIGELLIRKGFAVNPAEWEKEIKRSRSEGRLFPDSYLFPRGANQEKILQIFERNFQKKVVAGLNQDFPRSGFGLQEVLTLASMVEREAKSEVDRRLVAGILLKRLKNDWPLQVDATVQYAIASRKCSILKSPCNWWPNNLSTNDLKTKSLYNTYLHRGLPQAPICNPGLSSIKAVLNPQESEYWYYISGKDGRMHYAKTGEEHQQNIQKYLR